MTLVQVGINAGRRAPVEYADAVEKYFRRSDRHGRLYWVPAIRTWVIKVTLRPDDPRMGAWREGRLTEEPFEQIELAEYKEDAVRLSDGRVIPGYVGYDLEELGVSGLVNMLEEADVQSGRGRFNSLSEAVAFQRQAQKDAHERARKAQRDAAVDRSLDRRRSVLKIPFLGVGIDLKRPAKTPAGGS